MNTQIDFSVIDQMFSAQLSMNQSKEQLDALRPKVEEAVKELLLYTLVGDSTCSATPPPAPKGVEKCRYAGLYADENQSNALSPHVMRA